MGKHFKELEIILSDYICNKNCPYCTAKITKWPVVKDDLYQLYLYVGQLKKLGYKFDYLTVGGNGEPTLHRYEKLKEIVEMFKDYDIPVKRVLTSGNVFKNAESKKFDLFHDNGWLFEVTTTSFDNKLDRETLKYDFNYFEFENFKKARIRLNYVMIKRNFSVFTNEIVSFSDKYPNIETLAIKLLNVNTKTGLVDNGYSDWIYKEAVSKDKRNEIKNILDSKFSYKGQSFDTFSWEMESGREVYFSWKKVKYGLYDLVYYGDRFMNYQLEDAEIDLLPKVYIASRFIKTESETEKIGFHNDFRSRLIGDDKLFVDFNNKTFVYNEAGIPTAQYIGPFYNEKASDGTLTSDICDEVVQTENKLIDRCNIFIAYFDEIISPGGITELIYAAFKKKAVVIFFKLEDDVKYELKTSCWYPITTVKQLNTHTEVYPVKNENDVIKYIKSEIWK